MQRRRCVQKHFISKEYTLCSLFDNFTPLSSAPFAPLLFCVLSPILQHGKPVAMQALLTSPPPPMTSRAGDVTDAAPSADALGRHIDASLLQPVRDACAAAVAAGGPGAVAGIAAINGPSQVVLSGDEAAVAAAAAMLRTSKFARRAVPLGVSCPFHCSIMTPAAAVLRPVVTALLGDSPSAHSVHDGSSKLQAEAQIAMRTLRDSCAASRSGSMPMLTLADGADSRAAIWREVDWLVERLFETAASHGASGGDKARVADGLGARQQRRLRCPIITNADAAVHHDPASAGAQLFEGITKPVLWYPCTVQALILAAAAARAADSSAASAAAPLGLPSLVQDEEAALSSSSSSGAAAISFVEFGPGNTLTTLVKQIAGAHPQLLAAHAAASGTPPAKPLELRAASVSTPADLRTALSLLA